MVLKIIVRNIPIEKVNSETKSVAVVSFPTPNILLRDSIILWVTTYVPVYLSEKCLQSGVYYPIGKIDSV